MVRRRAVEVTEICVFLAVCHLNDEVFLVRHFLVLLVFQPAATPVRAAHAGLPLDRGETGVGVLPALRRIPARAGLSAGRAWRTGYTWSASGMDLFGVEQLGELAGLADQEAVYQVVNGPSGGKHPGHNAVFLPNAVHAAGGLGVVHRGPRTLDKNNIRAFATGPDESDRGARRLNVADEHAALGISQELIDGELTLAGVGLARQDGRAVGPEVPG